MILPLTSSQPDGSTSVGVPPSLLPCLMRSAVRDLGFGSRQRVCRLAGLLCAL